MKDDHTMPQRLPTVIHEGKKYFADRRLREFRTVNPPLQFVSFDSELGRKIDSATELIKRFALLGSYVYGNRNHIEIIASSEQYEQLVQIQEAITVVNEKLEHKDREWNLVGDEVQTLINDVLSCIDIMDEMTEYIHEIEVLGIFQMKECNLLR